MALLPSPSMTAVCHHRAPRSAQWLRIQCYDLIGAQPVVDVVMRKPDASPGTGLGTGELQPQTRMRLTGHRGLGR